MIIGLSGKAGAGKDSVADYLVNYYDFAKVSFADPIKRAAMDWWDFSYEQLWGGSEFRNQPDRRYMVSHKHQIKEYYDAGSLEPITIEEPVYEYLTPRKALQTIGSDIARSLDKDVWLRYGINIAKQLLDNPNALDYDRTKGIIRKNKSKRNAIRGIVIPDARFTNELLRIKKEDGLIVRINRPGAGLKGDAAKHCSETEHQNWSDDKFDYCLQNDCTLDELKHRVDDMMAVLLKNPVVTKQLELF